MVNLVKHCLFISYYLGRFSGVLNFEIDLKTGRSRVTKRATMFAAISHLLLIFLMWFLKNRTRFVTQELFKANSQDLTDRLSNTYELQLLCMAVTYYLNAVGSFYMMFSVGKYKNLIEDWPPIVILLGALYFLFFFLDNWVTMNNSFHLLDVHAELVKLMEQRTLFSPGLDNRLEKTVSAFI